MNQLIIEAINQAESPDNMFSELISDPYIIRMAAWKDVQNNTTVYMEKLVNMGVNVKCTNVFGQNALHTVASLINENCWIVDNNGTGMNYSRGFADFVLSMRTAMYLINKYDFDPLLEDIDGDTPVDIANCATFTKKINQILLLPVMNKRVGKDATRRLLEKF